MTIVEPKARLLNILGIPRAIVDLDFAKMQYVPWQDLQDMRFEHIVSNDEYVCNTLGEQLGTYDSACVARVRAGPRAVVGCG